MLNDFKKLMSARFLLTLAVSMQAVILGWKMYELTHDPLFLGFIGLSEAVPALGLALYAGYVVDRSRPLLIYGWVVAGSLLSGLLLLASQLSQVGLDVHGQILALFAASFITGTARGFSQPAVFAIVPRIVSRPDLPKASAWMTSAMQIARIAGPAAGGLVFGYAGMVAASSVICVFLIAAMVAVSLIRTSPAAPERPKQSLGLKSELLSGLNFVFGHRILLPALTLDMISVLFGGVTALLPIYASDILQVGPKGLGILRAAPAVGAAITSVWLTRKLIRKGAGTWLFASVTGFGVCILVFALSRDLLLSIVALGLSGAFDSVSMVIRTSAVQLSSPDSMRGRISAVNSIFIGSSNELGELESGVAAKLLGTVPSAVVGGVLCLLTVGATAILSPTLRKLDLDELARQ